MFETASNLTVAQYKSQSNTPSVANNIPLSLPNIPRKPGSRGSLTSKKQTELKQKLLLPSLYYSQNDEGFSLSSRQKENVQLRNKAKFAKEVKQRLNIVLGQMVQTQNIGEEGDDDSDDFEQKILKNKEILKMQKLKKQKEKNEEVQRQRIQNEQRNKKQIKNNRNQSLYERRMKDYRNHSENKYLQKRKQTVKEQNHNDEFILQQSKDKEDLFQINKDKDRQREKDKQSQKKISFNQVSLARVLSQRSSQKNLNTKQVSKEIKESNQMSNLFDSIQNYLENPHQKKQEKQQLIGLALIKAKRDIEDKIKAIDLKIGAVNSIDSKEVAKPQELQKMNQSVRDWRRIQINLKKIGYESSNFDREIERINSLQQKNAECIEKYVEQQKILMQLRLKRNEIQSKKANTNSH